MLISDFQLPTILATVSQGYNAVIGADVYAVLESPEPGIAPVKVALRDVGAVADIIKDDGTYSAYIFNAAQSGKYSISVRVNDGEGQTSIKSYTTGSKAAKKRSKAFPSWQAVLYI